MNGRCIAQQLHLFFHGYAGFIIDTHDLEGHTQFCGQVPGGVFRAAAAELGIGQIDRVDALGIVIGLATFLQCFRCFHRHEEAQGAIPPARQGNNKALEDAYFLEVIAQPQDEGVKEIVEIGVAVRTPLGQCGDIEIVGQLVGVGGYGGGSKGHLDGDDLDTAIVFVEGVALPPRCVLAPNSGEIVEIDHPAAHRPGMLAEYATFRDNPLRVGHEATAIEDESAIVAAQQVRVGVDRLQPRSCLMDQALTFFILTRDKGRCAGIADNLRTGPHPFPRRGVGGPEVFADFGRDHAKGQVKNEVACGYPVDGRGAAGPGRVIAAFIEDAVHGEVTF